jgi:hypothetical protein
MDSGERAAGGERFLLPTDVIALALITSYMTMVSVKLLALHEHLPIVIFVVTWLSGAVSRVSQFRQGRRPALKAGVDNGRAMALTLAAGTAPWFGLGWFEFAYPDSPIWKPVHISAPMYAVGLLLAVATVALPFIRRARSGHVSDAPAASQGIAATLVPMAAIFLLSGSLVIALSSIIWLAALVTPYVFAAVAAGSPTRFGITISANLSEDGRPA